MKRNLFRSGVIFLVFVLVFITHAWVSAQVENTRSGPRIDINERSYDFKELKEGATVQHIFRVLNRGDRPLAIKSVKPT